MYECIGAEIDSILLSFLLGHSYHGRITGKCHYRKGIHIVEFPGQSRDISRGIRQLHIAVHLYVGSVPVEIQGIAPCFLRIGHKMHLSGEKEKLAPAVVPSLLRRKHIVLFPGIGPGPEGGQGHLGLISEGIGLDEDGIGEHIDIRREIEGLDLRIICSRLAFDDLPVLVAHRAASEKDGHTVFRVVIQEFGSQGIVVLVLKLDHIAPELGQVGIDVVFHLFALELRLVLNDLHIPDGVYHPGIHVPQSRIADKICVVVKKSGRPDYLTVTHTIYFQQLCAFSAQQPHETVFRLLLFLGGNPQGQHCRQHKRQ